MTEDLILQQYKTDRQHVIQTLAILKRDLDEYRANPKANPKAVANRERVLMVMAAFVQDTDQLHDWYQDRCIRQYQAGIEAGRKMEVIRQERMDGPSKEGIRSMRQMEVERKWPELFGPYQPETTPQTNGQATPYMINTPGEL